jgi:two-component system sensor histidine kinase KdpD
MTPRRGLVVGWLVWGSLLLLATALLVRERDAIDLAYAVLTMILIVLGGSVAGGRALGFTLAFASFVLIDYYFQQPYDRFSVNKPHDVVVLLAFLATAGVATDLLTRARQEAEAARQRASELESLSRLGAATLRHAHPEAALDALAGLVRETIAAAACSIFRRTIADDVVMVTRSVGDQAQTFNERLEQRAARLAVDGAVPVTLTTDGHGEAHDPAHFSNEDAPPLTAIVLALPLSANERTIGALVVRGVPALMLDAARCRFLAALSYYATLGLERARLFAEAAHAEALREANRAKDEILASVSHDLRTPLTTIKVLAQGAESRGEPSAPAIVEQADRLARMVRDLLELSRIRAGSSVVRPELNTAEDLVGAALRQAQGILDGRTVVPHVDLDSPVLVGTFDFVHTMRILGNLIENALRYTPPGGVVDLRARREGADLVFVVADRGSGVPQPEEARIFDVFYRPAGAAPDSGHAGLGLSIARTLAELQGGTLSYGVREGGGSEFTLRLPAADLDEPAVEELTYDHPQT